MYQLAITCLIQQEVTDKWAYFDNGINLSLNSQNKLAYCDMELCIFE